MPGKILVVEDRQDFRIILSLILRPLGHEIVEAENGQEGIEKALNEAPDLIIMDLALPGMDGIETTIKLKQNPRTAHIPVIAYTVWGEEFKEKALKAGMVHFLRKTAPPQALKEVIEKLLATRPQED